MDYDCNRQGCHREKYQTRFDAVHDCFEGKGRPSDIDFVVERKGHAIVAELKPVSTVNEPLPVGQAKTLLSFADKPHVKAYVWYLDGMTDIANITHSSRVVDGVVKPPVPVTFVDLFDFLCEWDRYARRNPITNATSV